MALMYCGSLGNIIPRKGIKADSGWHYAGKRPVGPLTSGHWSYSHFSHTEVFAWKGIRKLVKTDSTVLYRDAIILSISLNYQLLSILYVCSLFNFQTFVYWFIYQTVIRVTLHGDSYFICWLVGWLVIVYMTLGTNTMCSQCQLTFDCKCKKHTK